MNLFVRRLLLLLTVDFLGWRLRKRFGTQKPTTNLRQCTHDVANVESSQADVAAWPRNTEPKTQTPTAGEGVLTAPASEEPNQDYSTLAPTVGIEAESETGELTRDAESRGATIKEEFNSDVRHQNQLTLDLPADLSPSAVARDPVRTNTSETELSRTRYRAWVDAIFDRCFPSGSAGRLVVLDFNEDALNAVAESIGTTADEFVDLTRSFARPSDREDAFRFWRPEHDSGATYPLYVGILAALAYAASQLDYGQERRASFHRAFNEVIGSSAGTRWAAGFSSLTRYWTDLATFLQVDCAGERGTLVLGGNDIYRGGRHVAAAMLQSLMSKADRSSLLHFFDRYFTKEFESTDAAVVAAVESDVDAGKSAHSLLSTIFRRRYLKIKNGSSSDDATLLATLRQIVLGVYNDWRFSRLSVQPPIRGGVRLATNGSRNHSGQRLDGGLSRNTRFVVRSRAGALIEPTRALPAPKASNPSHDIQLTIDPGSNAKPANLLAQLRVGNETHTCAISLSRNNATMLQIASRSGETITRQLPQLLVFEENANGDWIRVNRLMPGHESAIVADSEGAPHLMEMLRDVSNTVHLRRMRDGLNSLSLIRLSLKANAERLVSDPLLVSLIQSQVTYVRLLGGLRIGRAYLSLIPPSVLFSRPGLEAADVAIDGAVVGQATRDRRFQLPAGLSEGHHTVQIDDGQLSFEITARPISSRLELDDHSAIGYEVSRPGNLMRLALKPGSQKLDAYPSTKVRLIVGGSVE